MEYTKLVEARQYKKKPLYFFMSTKVGLGHNAIQFVNINESTFTTKNRPQTTADSFHFLAIA